MTEPARRPAWDRLRDDALGRGLPFHRAVEHALKSFIPGPYTRFAEERTRYSRKWRAGRNMAGLNIKRPKKT
jgi:hypothetical protein